MNRKVTPDPPFYVSNIKYKPDFCLSDFVDSLNFTHFFKESGRKAVYFGTHDYTYSGGSHKAASLHSNAYISSIFSFISSAFPYLMLNSCLVNYYPSLNCSIPFHADNEESIHPGSYIVTLSLGETRTMFFKPIGPYKHDQSPNIALKNGDILLFSRASQDKYLHGIPPCFDPDNSPRPRISLTFRKTV